MRSLPLTEDHVPVMPRPCCSSILSVYSRFILSSTKVGFGSAGARSPPPERTPPVNVPVQVPTRLGMASAAVAVPETSKASADPSTTIALHTLIAYLADDRGQQLAQLSNPRSGMARSDPALEMGTGLKSSLRKPPGS